VAQVAGVDIDRPYGGSSGELDPRIEEVNETEEWVVRETTAGLLASALDGVTFEDSYQWEEVDAAEKRTRSGTSEEDVARKRLRPRPVVRPLNPRTAGQALSEEEVAGGAPRPEELPGKDKRQRRPRGEVNPIRMMRGMAKFNTTASFRDTEVRGLTWGQYLEDCPTARSELARGMVRERLRPSGPKTKKRKGKDVAAIAEVPVSSLGRGKAAPETPTKITNFYTVAKVNQHGPETNPKIFQVSKVLIDGGSVLNMIPLHLARQMGLKLIDQNEVLMRTAASTYHSINHYVMMDISIAGVSATIRCYCLPSRPSYSILLGRRWMKQVRAIGDYADDSYCIYDLAGLRYIVPSNPTPTNIRDEIPVLCINTCSEPKVLDEETCQDLEVPEEEVCRRLYRTIRYQAESDADVEEEDSDGSEDENDSYDSEEEDLSDSYGKGPGNGLRR